MVRLVKFEDARHRNALRIKRVFGWLPKDKLGERELGLLYVLRSKALAKYSFCSGVVPVAVEVATFLLLPDPLVSKLEEARLLSTSNVVFLSHGF